MMHSAEKKVTGNSIYTHSILYYFGRREHGQFSFVNSSLLSFMTFPSTLFLSSSVPSSLPLSCYIHNSKKLCFKKSLPTTQGLFFVSLVNTRSAE